jgi:hypothetical protein
MAGHATSKDNTNAYGTLLEKSKMKNLFEEPQQQIQG